MCSAQLTPLPESNSQIIIKDSINKARSYSDEKNYGRSFAHYLVVFQLSPPESLRLYEKEFANVLHLWGSILHNRRKYDDLFRCYQLASTYFPTNIEILNNLGVHALKLECYETAKNYFKNCLKFNPDYLPAEQNLQTTRYALVPRWHFPMLNDTVRNKAYAEAIFMEISHGYKRVLDIGTGTGIFSLFASKSKQCENIVACDYSETMYNIAVKVMKANNITNVKLYAKDSSLILKEDMKRRATLVVTEILDCGIFGEGILFSLIVAWGHLLKPGGRVIPAGVTLYVTAFRSNEISHKYRLQKRGNNILKLNELCLKHDCVTYEVENLRNFDVTYMTNTQKALYVNFNNEDQLRSIKFSAIANENVVLNCTEDGNIDGFAVWFTLHLNETVTLTNDPRHELPSCWDQVIKNVNHPYPVESGQKLVANLTCCEGCVQVKCREALSYDTTMKKSCRCFTGSVFTILFLNDFTLLNCLEQLSKKLLQQFGTTSKLKVLDISPIPILGLLLVQQGAHLTCRTDNIPVFEHICKINNLNLNDIKLVANEDFNDYTNDHLEFDIIFQNLIEVTGLLYEAEIYQAQVLKYCLTSRGVYIPTNVTVWAQIVECQWLDNVTKASDNNVCGFKIAEFINEFKSTEQRDIKFKKIPHTALTEPINLGAVEYDTIQAHTHKTNVTITHDGRANAIFYWFNIQFMEGIELNTIRDDSFVNNAAFMFESPQKVTKSQMITLALKQHKGIMKIYVTESD